MSGVPVYSSTPINPSTASKPTGITPKTALPPDQNASTPSNLVSTLAEPTKTAVPTQSTRYQPAQPGAAPVPAPTTQAPQPLQPTPTTTASTSTALSGPPPPQPGAIPSPPSITQRPSVPPPPKAGEIVQPPEFYAPAPTAPVSQPSAPPQQPMPPQCQHQVPNLTRAQPPASTTSALETGRRSLEHPPGYIQNPDAGADNVVNPLVRPLERLGGSGKDTSGLGDEPGVWDTAKKWAMDAAGKVGEMEKEVWRRINGEEK